MSGPCIMWLTKWLLKQIQTMYLGQGPPTAICHIIQSEGRPSRHTRDAVGKLILLLPATTALYTPDLILHTSTT